MDGAHFDQLTRSFAHSRRGFLRGLVGLAGGGLLGAAGLGGARARTCGGVGSVCREGATCCSGVCGPKDRTGRRRCGCARETDCLRPDETCQVAACVAGVCTAVPKTDGSACDDGKACTVGATCQAGVCTGGTAGDCGQCNVCDLETGTCQPANQGDKCQGDGSCYYHCHDGTCVATSVFCGGSCRPVTDYDVDYCRYRFQFCLSQGNTCNNCTRWMACVGSIDTQTACGTVVGPCE
jgi:hypothetical protein